MRKKKEKVFICPSNNKKCAELCAHRTPHYYRGDSCRGVRCSCNSSIMPCREMTIIDWLKV